MEYVVEKSINNNVVLAKNKKSNEQVILMSKGIGFNRKRNDIVSDVGEENQVFILWNTNTKMKNVSYDEKELESVVAEICTIAQEKLGIHKDNIYKSLFDHIQFLVDRIQFGLTIDNPFQNEISILYAKEYEVAKLGVELLNTKMGIDVGEAEIAFITLHLNSSLNKHSISTSLDQVRIYSKIANHVESLLHTHSMYEETDIRIFLMSLNRIVNGKPNAFQLDHSLLESIQSNMADSYKITKQIVDIINQELQIILDEHAIGFITVEVERIKQLNQKKEG
ncbi:PRD domain-containing protein [Paludicola sp. MB14-C6]|uniref:PRD domain-containing protein n=1 Tax=Paludihabitans sp. MB14-C6 TaxID=3070656 RepID=UPI0027DD02B6|nr:PRD domain-containing protein [Paludicola sp. MB14-C6]WMJ23987.1 PRD domain-containing protein [Paludicola sp. MB14-C6]